MKGDFSRETFDPTKHYSGVRMQQGRVQTDADWNEQEALQRRRIRVEARDVIGRCGAPEDNAGFAVSVTAGAMRIGAGRYYVDGILCENEVDGLAYEAQPDLPGVAPFAEALAKAKATAALAYLDVWERHITPLDDPLLREVALGGPDTTTRVKTIWQVRLLPIAVAAGDPALLKDLQSKRAEVQKKLDAVKAAGGSAADIAQLTADLAAIDARIAALSVAVSCDSPFKEWDELVADPDRRMNARTQPPTSAIGPCVVPPTSGYRRLENQLYRVEVHTPGPISAATFKWSRDNGSVVTAVEQISGKDITVHDLGPDDVLCFAPGQWVELSDDRLELEGKPGQLAQIDAVNTSLRRITLKVAPTPLATGATGVDRAMHPKLRRWDQAGATATANGVSMTAAWTSLEDGVEVQFSTSTFRTGDYWVVPARTATGEVEWPPFANPNTAPLPQLPRGIGHRFCRLALLAFDVEKKVWSVASDCRQVFAPLTEPCCTRDASHVVATNWDNDDVLPSSIIVREGLRIRLDRAPDPRSLSSDTVQVSVEARFPDSTGFARVYLNGRVTRDPADDRVIIWMPPIEPVNGLAGPVLAIVPPSRARKAAATSKRAAAATRAAPEGATRLRVTLKGHLIWSDARAGMRVFVDGQAFGQPGLRADGKNARIALTFPSGAKASASDFESWFFIGGRTQPAPLQVTTVRFLNFNEANSSAGEVKPPVAAGTTVSFKAGEAIHAVEVTFNRAVLPASVGPNAPSVFIERDVVGTAGKPRMPVELTVNGNVVRLVLRDPTSFNAGKYLLNCLGTSPVTTVVPTVKALDDSSLLDGDYDNQAGGNFALAFTAL